MTGITQSQKEHEQFVVPNNYARLLKKSSLMFHQKALNTNLLFLKEKLEHGAVLLDVRTHHEHAGYHLEGAINIPCEEIECMKSFIKDWNKPVIVFSAQGRRSAIATLKLKRAGVEAYNAGTMWELESFFNCN